MSFAGKNRIGLSDLGNAIEEILSRFDQDIIEERATAKAAEICKKYRPEIKKNARGKIKHPVSPKPYVNSFSVVKREAGAGLWNKKYQLSHLIEKPHRLAWGGSTHNEYHFFQETEEPMAKEFEEETVKIVDELIEGK